MHISSCEFEFGFEMNLQNTLFPILSNFLVFFFGNFWEFFVNFGNFWEFLGIFGNFREFLGIFWEFWEFRELIPKY